MKWLAMGLGGLSLAGGVITLPTPLPFGVPLIALGLALIYPYSRRLRARMRLLSRKSEMAAAVVDRIERSAWVRQADRSQDQPQERPQERHQERDQAREQERDRNRGRDG